MRFGGAGVVGVFVMDVDVNPLEHCLHQGVLGGVIGCPVELDGVIQQVQDGIESLVGILTGVLGLLE